ncbi:helix-turn-helix transcriptional regulator [Streptomonospora halophila]|uniref:Helix-turn-helix transcriptional regulator n=1 Tax=Streptomonospora halophila TaxID=427369 RepID=A0ABP9G1R7_9ACTN
MVQKIDPLWLRFGRQLRWMREQAGVSQDQLAKALNVSPSMLSAMERGTRGTKSEYLDQIEQVLNTGGQVRQLWERVTGSNAFPEWFRDIEQLQRRASEIREYHPLLVPGLLQSEEYARAIIRLGYPTSSTSEIDEQVKARIGRQAILASDRPPLLLVVLDEMVLRRPFGGSATMTCQLDHLLGLSDQPHVVVQVVPFATEQHPGLDGAFTLMTLPGQSEILYLETRISGTPVDETDGVQEYSRVFGELRGAALPPKASRELIGKIRGEFL